MQAAEQTRTLPVALQRPSLVAKFAHKYTIEPDKLMGILRATAFKVKDGEATNEQMAALLVVADQYGLNPFTREIFAFPDKQNGIVPVVGVDGWTRIINDHWASNGFEFRESEKKISIDADAKECPEWIEVVIYRKDRDHPIVVREYLDEVYRPLGTYKDGGKHKPGPWQTHTKRFLRHKALIQGARIAYGFTGIYDEDEAGRIVDGQIIREEPQQQPQRGAAGLKNALLAGSGGNGSEIQGGDGGGGGGTTHVQNDSRSAGGGGGAHGGAGSDGGGSGQAKPAGTVEQRDRFVTMYGSCADTEALALQADAARAFEWTPADQTVLSEAYGKKLAELGG